MDYRGFNVNDNGIVQNPGKFEGEYYYAIYFYDRMLDGAEDETIDDNDRQVSVFIVNDDDRREFTTLELDSTYAVLLWETDNGFVETREMTEGELERYRAECENADPSEPEDDDLTTTDHEKFYQNGRLVLERERTYARELTDRWFSIDKTNTMTPLTRGTLKNAGVQHFGDDHKAALRAYMDRVQFWPNVWFISDHGNAHLMTLTEDK